MLQRSNRTNKMSLNVKYPCHSVGKFLTHRRCFDKRFQRESLYTNLAHTRACNKSRSMSS